MEEEIVTEPVLEEDGLSLSTQKVGFWVHSKYYWQLHWVNSKYKEAIDTLISKIKDL